MLPELSAFVLNDHSWYRIDDTWDVARAALWCAANLVTAFCYFAIPWELRHWRRELPYQSVALIATMFMGFIFFCGVHHVVDVLIMPTAPWWAIWTANIPMAGFSIATWIIIRRQRRGIMWVLGMLRQAMS